MMLQMKVNLHFTTSAEVSCAIPGIVTLSIKLKFFIFFLNLRSVLLYVKFYEHVYFCFFSIQSCLITTNSLWSPLSS